MLLQTQTNKLMLAYKTDRRGGSELKRDKAVRGFSTPQALP